MSNYYLVTRGRGSRWDHARGRREQVGWDEHAAFMDALAAEGFVELGGPVGEGDGDDVVLVVRAASEDEVVARLREDPWPGELLTLESVRPWSVWLRHEPRDH